MKTSTAIILDIVHEESDGDVSNDCEAEEAKEDSDEDDPKEEDTNQNEFRPEDGEDSIEKDEFDVTRIA